MPAEQTTNTEYYNQLFDSIADNANPSKEDDRLLLLLPTELYKQFFKKYPTVDGSKASMYENLRPFIESDSYRSVLDTAKNLFGAFWNILAETYDLNIDIFVYSWDCPIILMVLHIVMDVSRKLFETMQVNEDYSLVQDFCYESTKSGINYSEKEIIGLSKIFPRLLLSVFDKYKFREIIKITQETLCLEDFSEKESLRKIDCYRKFYHTRSGKEILSLDKLKENYLEQYDEIFDIESEQATPDEEVSCWTFTDRFLNILDETDRRIIEMRMLSFPLKDIADHLGFKTHSAVLKRLWKLENRFRKYVGKNYNLDSYLKPEYRKSNFSNKI